MNTTEQGAIYQTAIHQARRDRLSRPSEPSRTSTVQASTRTPTSQASTVQVQPAEPPLPDDWYELALLICVGAEKGAPAGQAKAGAAIGELGERKVG